MALMLHLLSTLLPTVAIELGVLLFLRERRRRVLWGSVGMNVVTNVALNLYMTYCSTQWTRDAAVGELAVVAAEAAAYYALTRNGRQACIYSVLCNGISLLTGLLFQLAAAYFRLAMA